MYFCKDIACYFDAALRKAAADVWARKKNDSLLFSAAYLRFRHRFLPPCLSLTCLRLTRSWAYLTLESLSRDLLLVANEHDVCCERKC